MRLLSLLAAVAITQIHALNNGLGLTPQMGWNSWNHFACGINETLIQTTANAMVSSGLASLGYEYVNLDDCWQISRDSQGRIVEDPTTFPSGIGALADYVHKLGLKLGVYSDAGEFTCQKRPGGLGYETSDATSYANWGVDYLKYDNCFSNTSAKLRYPPMRDALNKTGRPIFFSMCEWGEEDPATWAADVGNSWRTTGDIANNFVSMLSNLDYNDKWHALAGPGHWNDPDMLEVGNGVFTTTESISHFSLWALIKAPLIIGCDVTTMSNDTVAILSNTEVIAINQDPLGVQGWKRQSSLFGGEVWAGPLADGSTAVVLLNRGLFTQQVSIDWNACGLVAGAAYQARDLWAHQDLGSITSFTTSLASHASMTLKLTPVKSDDVATTHHHKHHHHHHNKPQ